MDRFIAGQQAIADQQSASVKNMVGGTESYDAMSEWASNNLSETEKGEVVLKVLRKIMKFSNSKDEKLAWVK